MSTAPNDSAGMPQGDLALLETETAQRLLAATIPARMAFIAPDGTPRIVPSWFHWTGAELVMPTYIAGPRIGIRHPAARVAALRARPDVAVSIDTETFPPQSLTLRGKVEITEVAPGGRGIFGREPGATSANRPRQACSPAWTSPEPCRPGSRCGRPGSGCSTSSRACRACREACDERGVRRAGDLGRRLHHRTGPFPQPGAGPRRRRPVRLVRQRRHAQQPVP